MKDRNAPENPGKTRQLGKDHDFRYGQDAKIVKFPEDSTVTTLAEAAEPQPVSGLVTVI